MRRLSNRSVQRFINITLLNTQHWELGFMKLSMQIKYNSTAKLKAVTANFGMYIYPVHVDAKFKPVKSDILSYRVVGNVHDISNPNQTWIMSVTFTLDSSCSAQYH